MALGTRVEHGLEVGEMYFVVYLSEKKKRKERCILLGPLENNLERKT